MQLYVNIDSVIFLLHSILKIRLQSLQKKLESLNDHLYSLTKSAPYQRCNLTLLFTTGLQYLQY